MDTTLADNFQSRQYVSTMYAVPSNTLLVRVDADPL